MPGYQRQALVQVVDHDPVPPHDRARTLIGADELESAILIRERG
jgi:hypothetical protein